MQKQCLICEQVIRHNLRGNLNDLQVLCAIYVLVIYSVSTELMQFSASFILINVDQFSVTGSEFKILFSLALKQ